MPRRTGDRRDLVISRLLLALAGLGIVFSAAAGDVSLVAFFVAAALVTKFLYWQRHIRSK